MTPNNTNSEKVHVLVTAQVVSDLYACTGQIGAYFKCKLRIVREVVIVEPKVVQASFFQLL